MKGRKLGAAGVALALLAAAAVAVSSVGAAGAATSALPQSVKFGHGLHKSVPRVAVGSFKTSSTNNHQALPSQSVVKSLQTSNNKVRIKGLLNGLKAPTHVKNSNYKAGGAAVAGPPNGPNLPFTGPGSSVSGIGITAFLNEEVNGGFEASVEPDPSPALCEGAGQVMQVTEDTVAIGDGVHWQNLESLYLFFANNFANAPFNGEADIILDHPHCYYDNGTKHWFVAVDAFDLNSGASAVMIAASVLGTPVGTWYFYNVDTTTTGDGSSCDGDLCYGHLTSLGANKNGIFLTTDQWSSDDIISFVPNVSTLFGFGSSIWALDLTGLALGLPIGVISWDVSNYFDNFAWGVYATTSPNGNWNLAHGGTEFLLMSWDPQGSLSNYVFLFAITNTSTISFVESGLELSATLINGLAGLSTWFGLPVTDTNCSNVNIGYFVINTITCVDQPPYGATPLGDFLGFAYGGIPRPINAGDDSIADGKAVTIPNKGPTTVGFVLTTKAVVQDSVHVNHLRAGTYYGFAHPTAWDGLDIVGAAEDRTGIISNANNSFIFPSIGVATDANKAVIAATLTGNAHFPSVVFSKVQKFHGGPSAVNIVTEGQAPYDGFFQYPLFPAVPWPFAELFWGEYSSAVADGGTVFFTAEGVAFPGCSDSFFAVDSECGGTRSWGQNWTTTIGAVNA